MKEKLIHVLETEQKWFSKRGKSSFELDVVLRYLKDGDMPKNPLNFPLLCNCIDNIESVYFEYGIV